MWFPQGESEVPEGISGGVLEAGGPTGLKLAKLGESGSREAMVPQKLLTTEAMGKYGIAQETQRRKEKVRDGALETTPWKG